MTDWALLIVAGVAHLAPEHLAAALGHKVAAWERVAWGIEAVALWSYAAATAVKMRYAERVSLVAVACYGVFESSLRVVCRAAHPMNEVLRLPEGQTSCQAAGIGFPGMSLVAVAIVATVVAWSSSRTL